MIFLCVNIWSFTVFGGMVQTTEDWRTVYCTLRTGLTTPDYPTHLSENYVYISWTDIAEQSMVLKSQFKKNICNRSDNSEYCRSQSLNSDILYLDPKDSSHCVHQQLLLLANHLPVHQLHVGAKDKDDLIFLDYISTMISRLLGNGTCPWSFNINFCKN